MPQPDRPAAAAPVAPAELPAEVVARLEAVLQDETGVPEVPWDRPAVAAAVGAVAVIGVLLVAMTLVGALL